MLRYGYDRRVASGVIAASGTLAQIIPPSLVLIVMADQLGRSVGDMYEGAFLPGLMLAGFYAAYVVLLSFVFPNTAPGLPVDAIRYREPDGTRGVWQLGVLTLFSAFVAYYLMRQTSIRAGADFVVLTMSVGVVVCFLCSVFNRLFGARFIYVTFGLLLLFVAACYYFYTHDNEALAILTAALSAGALYALIAAIIERISGFRIISAMAEQVTFVMVPPLALIFLVLGTIFIGVATPTEGGAMGASGALILALLKRRLSWDLTRQAVQSTAKLSAFVVFILIGARVFSLTFYGVDGHKWVEEMLVSLPGGQIGFLAFVNVFVFVLAFFLDFFEIAFIVIPLIGPAAEHLGIDLIWFGVMLGVNMQTSFMHPPFGFALFYLRSVAPRERYLDRLSGKVMAPVTTGEIYWGAVPFVVIQCIAVAAVIAFPALVMHYKGTGPVIDPSKINIEIPPPDLPPALELGPSPR
jgi:TRAP-type mannitol/chloroaromatic compound transport system permease large subunit